jgi:hypothetical protein
MVSAHPDPPIPMRTPMSLVLAAIAAAAPSAAHGQAPPAAAESPVALRPGPQRTPPFEVAPGLAAVALDAGSHARLAASPGPRHGTSRLALGGVVGGGLGLLAGMSLGAAIDGASDEECIDMCFGPGLILGALGGEALGMALGVNLANGRKGSLPANLLASAAILTGGIFATHESGLLIVVPVGQLGGTIAVERAVERRRR